jgi:hypothetical protein
MSYVGRCVPALARHPMGELRKSPAGWLCHTVFRLLVFLMVIIAAALVVFPMFYSVWPQVPESRPRAPSGPATCLPQVQTTGVIPNRHGTQQQTTMRDKDTTNWASAKHMHAALSIANMIVLGLLRLGKPA